MAQEIGALSGPPGTENPLRKQQYMEEIGQAREIAVWEREDAPPGSTAESLLVFENGRPVRVAGPTHYVHLADGRVTGGYGGGTHHSDVDADGRERVVRIIANHAA
jgi:hypothetical protein